VGSAISDASVTDVYEVICPEGASYLFAAVRDAAPVKTPLISIQLTNDGSSSGLETDKVDGNADFSPTVKLAKGTGLFHMYVDKSALATCNSGVDNNQHSAHDVSPRSQCIGAELYTAKFSCRDDQNVILDGTTWRLTQDQ
jgi:hypothetical protein